MSSHPNTFPKLHDAAWPGVVGNGEGSTPAIGLDAMLDLTAAADADLFQFAPRSDIDRAGRDHLLGGSVATTPARGRFR